MSSAAAIASSPRSEPDRTARSSWQTTSGCAVASRSKLLPVALADEPDFVQRFHQEVQAAAALRHPHIIVVHDWGADGGLHVVTEYLDGGSLRGVLDRGTTLSPAQALMVGLAAARALEFAHAKGVVHRDIKASNVLFADDGRLRIGDFGLARAFAEAAWTEPLGAGGAAARYASPEQAQGRSIDGRADVYSLALVLVEAVTGQVPFAADTAIATLMARVGTPLVVPPELGPLVGPLTRAGADDPEDRIDAAGLVTALMAVASELPDPAPLPLSPAEPEILMEPPHEDDTLVVSRAEVERLAAAAGAPAVLGAAPTEAPEATPAELPDDSPDVEPWIAAGAAASTAHVDRETAHVDREKIGGVAPAAAEVVDHGTSPQPPGQAEVSGGGPGPSATAVDVSDDGGGREDAEADDVDEDGEGADLDAARSRNSRRWRIAWILFAVILVVGGGVVGALIVHAHRTPTHPVPVVAGNTTAAATSQLEALGFTVGVVHVRRDGTAAGDLLGTRPAAGTSVAEGRTVVLVVSDGPTLVTLPTDLAGSSADAASARLTKLGLRPQAPQEAFSETALEGTVIGYASGTPKRLEKGSSVTFVVSKGPEPRTIPDTSGMTPAQVEARLTQLGLVPNETQRFDTKVDKGGLIGLNPASGTQVPRGATVEVVVSKGLLVAVPSLDGVSTVKGAIAKLEAVGLVAGKAEGSGSLSGQPVAFDPPAGQLVAKGSTVNIVVR